MSVSYCLLLTACIAPNGMANTKLNAPEERLRQYLAALDYFLTQTPYRIIFCENSGYDLRRYFQFHPRKDRLEYLSFSADPAFRPRGKGYGEALIIEYAAGHSVFWRECDFVVKITGRLKVHHTRLNLELLARWSRGRPFFAGKLNADLDSCTSEFFVAEKSFYEHYFLPEKERIDDRVGRYFEKVLLEAVNRWRQDGAPVLPFPVPAAVEGCSGTSGLAYRPRRFRMWLSQLKYLVTVALRYQLRK